MVCARFATVSLWIIHLYPVSEAGLLSTSIFSRPPRRHGRCPSAGAMPTRILTTTAMLILLASPGRAQTPTFARIDYPTSDAPRGIATGDFNRDGAMDLALVNTGRKSVVVLM